MYSSVSKRTESQKSIIRGRKVQKFTFYTILGGLFRTIPKNVKILTKRSYKIMNYKIPYSIYSFYKMRNDSSEERHL